MSETRALAAARTDRWLFGLALAIYLVSRFAILQLPPQSSDVTKYHARVARAAQGEVPYRDIALEYPPLAWWLMVAAAPIDAGAGAGSFESYRLRFRLIGLGLEAFAFAFFVLLVRLRQPERAASSALLYAVASIPLAHVIYDRLDAGLLFFLMAAALAWQLSLRPGPGAGRWRLGAYALVGLGAVFKVVPLLLLPFLLLAERSAPQRGRRSALGIGVCALAGGLPFAPHLIQAGPAVLDFLGYHAQRGLQIESVPASLLLLLASVGLDVTAYRAFESWALAAPGASALTWIATVLLVLGLGALWLRQLRAGDRDAGGRALSTAMLALLVASALSKVLSPQFLVWLVPLLLLVRAEAGAAQRDRWFIPALLAMLLLTVWLYPYHYFSHIPPQAFFDGTSAFHDPLGLVPQLNLVPRLVLVARNALFCALVGLLLVRHWRSLGTPAK